MAGYSVLWTSGSLRMGGSLSYSPVCPRSWHITAAPQMFAEWMAFMLTCGSGRSITRGLSCWSRSGRGPFFLKSQGRGWLASNHGPGFFLLLQGKSLMQNLAHGALYRKGGTAGWSGTRLQRQTGLGSNPSSAGPTVTLNIPLPESEPQLSQLENRNRKTYLMMVA